MAGGTNLNRYSKTIRNLKTTCIKHCQLQSMETRTMTKTQYQFNEGDRVAERPKPHGLFAISNKAREIVARNSTQRYGTVLGHTTKVDKSGRRTKFLVIQWDHLKSPMTHATCRICPIDQLATLVNQTLVPGE